MRGSVRRCGAFTLLELLVSVAVLTLLILITTRLISSATTLTTVGNKHLDSDNQVRPVLDRMAEDFSQVVKRTDVDYFLKGPNGTMTGNDQIAFYSQVPGYYPSAGSQSPVSLIGYRVNSTTKKLERTGNGLVWNGVSTTDTPVVFLPLTIASTWPAATNQNQVQTDPVVKNYEPIGPQIFRFEYFYQLAQGDLYGLPWDDINQSNSTVNGLHDVGAIVVTLATIDAKSRVLVSDAQLVTLTGQMADYIHFNSPGNSGKVGPALTEIWQDAINASTLPKAALAGIRVYQRYFYLNGLQQ